MTNRIITAQPTAALKRELLLEEYVRLGEMRECAKSLKRSYFEACAKLGKRRADSVLRDLLNLPF